MSEHLSERNAFVSFVRELRQRREQGKIRARRIPLTLSEREAILKKAGRRCHICGGTINGAWHADHVRPHSGGGLHEPENYLPAHATCNIYRWNYLPEEFELVLKLGVWARDQVQKQTTIGHSITEAFLAKERERLGRRRLTKHRA